MDIIRVEGPVLLDATQTGFDTLQDVGLLVKASGPNIAALAIDRAFNAIAASSQEDAAELSASYTLAEDTAHVRAQALDRHVVIGVPEGHEWADAPLGAILTGDQITLDPKLEMELETAARVAVGFEVE